MKRYCNKGITYTLALFFILLLSNCSGARRSQCPAYREYGENVNSKGIKSVQEVNNKSADDVRKESISLISNEFSYIRVKRNKKTGLVMGTKRIKNSPNKHNMTATDKGFKREKGSHQGAYMLQGVEDDYKEGGKKDKDDNQEKEKE